MPEAGYTGRKLFFGLEEFHALPETERETMIGIGYVIFSADITMEPGDLEVEFLNFVEGRELYLPQRLNYFGIQ